MLFLKGSFSFPIHEEITRNALFRELSLKEGIVREVVKGNRDTDLNTGLGKKYNQTLHFDNGVVNYDNIINSVNLVKENYTLKEACSQKCENVLKYRQVIRAIQVPVQVEKQVLSTCLVQEKKKFLFMKQNQNMRGKRNVPNPSNAFGKG
jgi:hypothetical protein